VDLVFRRGTELAGIQILGDKTLRFGKQVGSNFVYSGIEGLKLSIQGILQEFPDLKDKTDKEIKEEGLKRFLEHLKSLKNDIEIMKYLQRDLVKHGYQLQLYMRKGHRPVKVK